MPLGKWVYLNGAFHKAEAARISPFDRAFLFAHAAYEVTAVYGGRLIDFDAHLARLGRTLEGIEIPAVPEDLTALHQELITRNTLTEGLVYLQVGAGDYGHRDFYGPEEFTPTLFMFSTEKQLIGEAAQNGLTAISHEDTRWPRRHLKTTQLLSQSLAYRAARRAGSDTALMHEDGLVTEFASANAWLVTGDGELITRDLSAALLPGITRQSLITLLTDAGLRVKERPFTLAETRAATELFSSSTGMVIAPVLALDGVPIGNGQPGPVTRQVQRIYYDYIGADVRSVAPWAL